MNQDLQFLRRSQEYRPWVYLSGPMAKQPYIGPRDAMALATRLWRAGWHPVLPQLCSIWEMSAGPLDPVSADGVCGWMEYDMSLLSRCQAIVRLPGVSSGADREITVAQDPSVGILLLSIEDALRGPDEFFVYDSRAHAEDRWRRRSR